MRIASTTSQLCVWWGYVFEEGLRYVSLTVTKRAGAGKVVLIPLYQFS